MIYAIYDLEILKAIPPKDEADRLPDIEYCDGWKDYENMGISCWAYCWLDTEDWSISKPIAGTGSRDKCLLMEFVLMALLWRSHPFPIGGFNTKKFDDLLLAANGFPSGLSNFDILAMVIDAAGDADVAYWDEGRSYSLAKIAAANGYQKTLSGEQAPIEWQRGNHQQVIEYCKNDVLIEAETLKRLLQGALIDPNTGKTLRHRGI
jgi:DEAD/DEAH box helicase domain-containing protein